jgi:hypothetical protein
MPMLFLLIEPDVTLTKNILGFVANSNYIW